MDLVFLTVLRRQSPLFLNRCLRPIFPAFGSFRYSNRKPPSRSTWDFLNILAALRTKKQVFQYLKDKVWSHLNNWKHTIFSKGGKEIFLKSFIQAIPTYTMACFHIPIATCHSQSIMANLWWGFNANNRPKVHWQSWQKLSKSKKEGSLGFRSLVHFDQAMLAKQAWRILKHPNSIIARNKEIKIQTTDQAHAILNLAKSYLAKYKAIVATHNAPHPVAKSVATTIWTLPPQGLLKLNTDTTSSKNHLTTSNCGIIHNSEGGVVAAVAFPHTGGGDAAILEAKFLLNSLRWCIEESFCIH
uniref:RNase H type-1 domain-containing protein n=1 Tax=Cannabis sativa TaxID=3483 RepID=A0A803Q8Q9_CANSA